MSAILLLEELKQYLGITDESQDERLKSILEDLPAYVKLKTGRWFGCVEETVEVHDFNSVIFLNNVDVDSITWIKTGYSNDHDFDDDTSLKTLTTADYRWSKDTGRITLGFPYRRNRSRYDYDQVIVKYKFGVQSVPGDIKLAAKQYAGDAFRAIDGEVTSESLDSFRRTYKTSSSAADIFSANQLVNL